MKRTHGLRMMTAAAGLALMALAAGPAQAQVQAQSWTFRGVSFAPRIGWCAKTTQQDGVDALEIRRCGLDFPYLTLGVGREAGAGDPLDLGKLTAEGANYAEGDESKQSVLQMAKDAYTTCTTNSYRVDHAPVPNLSSFAIIAQFACPSAPNGTVNFANLTSYAKQPDGTIWIVAFDFPDAPMTADDMEMIRGAIAAISSAR